MNFLILLIILVLAFICGDNVLGVMGYPHRDFTTSAIYRLHPLSYVAILLLIYYFSIGRLQVSSLIRQMKNEMVYLTVCLIIIGYLQVTNNLNAVSFFLDALILPVLLSILLKLTGKEILLRCRNLVYVFFFTNALIAILEKLKGATLIIHESEWQFLGYFRSSALFGHPLNNGLIMAVLTIILFLAAKDNWLKLSVLIGGMLAIFCFGARGALLGVFIGITLNILLGMIGSDRQKANKNIRNGLLYLGLFAVIIFFVVSYTQLGDRIAALSHVDDSAEARVDSYAIFNGLQLKDILWGGYNTNQIDYIQYISGVEIIENFYIVWILKFGLIMTVVLLIALIRFLFFMMKDVEIEIKLPILATLFFVASTNNSLSTNTLVISILVLAYYLMFESEVLNQKELLFIYNNL